MALYWGTLYCGSAAHITFTVFVYFFDEKKYSENGKSSSVKTMNTYDGNGVCGVSLVTKC
jgi:hypothetical protein